MKPPKRLHGEGASVLLNGRDEANLRAAAEEIGASHRVSILAADVANVATGPALVQAAEKEFGGVDILINNAGVFKPIPFGDVSEEQYDWFLDTILKGKFFMAQAAAKSMKKRGGGASSYGKGRVFWSSFPVELAEGTQAPADLYSYVAGKIGLVADFELQSPVSQGVLIYPTVLDDGVMYVLVSDAAEDTKIDLRDKVTGTRLNLVLRAQHAAIAVLGKREKGIVAKYGF